MVEPSGPVGPEADSLGILKDGIGFRKTVLIFTISDIE